MKKYKLTMEVKQSGQVLKTYTQEVETNVKPKNGDGFSQLTEPPIYHVIVSVEEI
jgi:hypothetical protein